MIPQVLLLSAGKSSRMWPLSDKIFFPYLGKTVLEHQVEMLLSSGFTRRIHIVGNESNFSLLVSLIREKFPSSAPRFTFSKQVDLDEGMLGGVLDSEKHLSQKEPLLVMSSNDFVDKSFFSSLLRDYKNKKSDVFLCGKKVDKYFPGGYLVLDSEQHVKEIHEKPGAGKEPSSLINLVLHLYRNPSSLFRVLKTIRKKKEGGYGYEAGLQALFDEGAVASSVAYEGYWQSLKYPWHHLSLMNRFLGSIKKSRIHKGAFVSEKASLSGPVWIEKGVRVYDFAVLQGPVYIGENTVIGNHTLVRMSHVGSDSVIGHGTEVARSYLKRSVWTHQNYIGDSIIDENVSFGAGAKTGNLRLDEGLVSVCIHGKKVCSETNKLGLICGKNVRVGINTSIMPGVRIGNNSFVGAGISVEKDVGDSSYVKHVHEREDRENLSSIRERELM